MRCEALKAEVFVSNLVDTSFRRELSRTISALSESNASPREDRCTLGESGGNLYYQPGAQPRNQETVWAT